MKWMSLLHKKLDGERNYRERKNKLFYSCHKKEHAFGTGFIINKKIKHSIIDCNAKITQDEWTTSYRTVF
jgi:hypothetical protein